MNDPTEPIRRERLAVPFPRNDGSNAMDKNERERLEKAKQCAQLLLSDIQEVHAKTDNVALEELMTSTIQQLANIIRLLKRLSEQR